MIAPLREVQKVRNAIAAYGRFEQWRPERESALLEAHCVLMAGLIDEVGVYRRGGDVWGSGDRVQVLMADLLRWLAGSDVHPLITSSVLHYEFEFIHPFADGNGRMGRLR